MNTDAHDGEVRALVLSTLEEHTSESEPLLARWKLLERIEAEHDGVARTRAAAEIDELADADRLLSWREKVALAEEPRLRSIVGAENMRDDTNKMLIVLCKRLIEQLRENEQAADDIVA